MPSSKWQKYKTKKFDCVGGESGDASYDDNADVYGDDDGIEEWGC